MNPRQGPSLRKDLGLWGAVAIVVGTVIGSGIFLVPKAMILRVGSPEMVFLVFVFGGVLSLFGALTYAELAAAMPEAGGEYVYLSAAYGPFFGFLYGWTQTWVAKSASIATLATGFFLYLANFFPVLDNVLTSIPLPIGPGGGPLEIRSGQILAMVVVMGLAVLNYFGVKFGGGVQIVVTAVKVACIAAIVILGLTASTGSIANFHTSVPAAGGFTGFFAALVAALWAYDGWNNVNMVASEIRNPQRNLPLALIGGTLLVIAIYLAANLAYFYVLSASDVSKSDRVAGEMMRQVMGNGGAGAVSVAAMISIFAALNGSILTGSRVPYALARDGYFFRPYAIVNEKYRTPGISILLLSAWSCVLLLSGRYDDLYTLVIFPSWILYAMAAASVIVLRVRQPDLPRPYKTLGYPVVPILFVCVAIVLIGSTLQDKPRESLLGLGLIAVGIPFYLYWNRQHTGRRVQ
ncbi:MAG: amino acid permease [Bryobacteraceae bacterium]|nr:amino acid permease [Bryobacteraceae bacterium]